MALTKEELMSRVAKYPDIIDVELVKVIEYTTITYKCGHTDTVILNNLLSRGNKSMCRVCIPIKPPNKKTNEQFLLEVALLSSDLEFIEEYKGIDTPISFKYKSCMHISKVIPYLLLSRGTGLICRVCNPIKKSNEQFLEEVTKVFSDIEFIEKYRDNKTPISFKYKSCEHTSKISPSNLFSRKDPLICRICNPANKKPNQQFLEEVNILTANIEFLEEYVGRDILIPFRYKDCEHKHKVSPGNLLSQRTGLICRTCNPIKKSNEQFLEEVAALTSDLEFIEEYIDSNTSISFRYKSCGHEHQVRPHSLLSKGHGLICRTCNPLQTSKGERSIAELLSKYATVETSNRTILGGLEIDIYLPQLNLGIEYNGEYWHSEEKIGRNYHLDKTKLAEKQGIRLIHIFEHEWLNKQEIVKSRLLGMLQQNYKLGARLCTIRELTFSDVRNFLNENHLQGAGSPSSINLGLYHKDDLVAVMTFSKPRFNCNYDYELIRYASLTGINIQGGASKLLKYFTNNYKGSIISYSDKRWSQGNLYKTIGFEFSHSSDPDYFYAKNNSILSRYQCQKHRLKVLFPSIYRDELTETDIMTSAGYYKVYGCGNDVWVLSNIKGKMGNGR